MARPNTQRMPRSEFMAELGSGGVVDESTLAEIEQMQARAGEPDDNRNLEQILASPKPDDEKFSFGDEDTEQPAPAAQEQQEQPEKPEDLSIEDRLRIQQEQINAQMEVYQRAMERRIQEQFPKQEQQPALEQEPEFMQYTQAQIEAYRQQDPYGAMLLELKQSDYRRNQELEQLKKRDQERDEALVKQRFSEALQAVKEKYPDADQYLPKELMTQALDISVKSRNHAADFRGWMESTYRNHAFDAKLSPAKPADQVSQKRDEKRQAAIKATGAAGGGGGVFQAPQFKTQDRSLRAGRSDFLAELRSLGG